MEESYRQQSDILGVRKMSVAEAVGAAKAGVQKHIEDEEKSSNSSAV